MISDYLHNDFDTTKCDELSAEIMDLLHALLSFGFYFSSEHLQDITIPLIQGLENRIDHERKTKQQSQRQRRRSSLLFWTPSQKLSDQKISRSPESSDVIPSYIFIYIFIYLFHYIYFNFLYYRKIYFVVVQAHFDKVLKVIIKMDQIYQYLKKLKIYLV